MDIPSFPYNPPFNFPFPLDSNDNHPKSDNAEFDPDFDFPTILPETNVTNIDTAPSQQSFDGFPINSTFPSQNNPLLDSPLEPAGIISSNPDMPYPAISQIELAEFENIFPSGGQENMENHQSSPMASTANTSIPLQTVCTDILSNSFCLDDINQSNLVSPSRKPAECPVIVEKHALSRKPSAAQSTDKTNAVKGNITGRKRTRTRTEDMDPSLVHTCPTCGKKFAKKYNQKIHQRRHQGDLPFVCEYEDCGKGFMWRSSFLRHLRVHESNPDRPRKVLKKASERDMHPSANGVDVMQVSEHTSIMLLNGMKIDINHYGLESIRIASALCMLNGTACRQLLDMNVDDIRQADKHVINTRSHHVNAFKQRSLDLSNIHVTHIKSLIEQSSSNPLS